MTDIDESLTQTCLISYQDQMIDYFCYDSSSSQFDGEFTSFDHQQQVSSAFMPNDASMEQFLNLSEQQTISSNDNTISSPSSFQDKHQFEINSSNTASNLDDLFNDNFTVDLGPALFEDLSALETTSAVEEATEEYVIVPPTTTDSSGMDQMLELIDEFMSEQLSPVSCDSFSSGVCSPCCTDASDDTTSVSVKRKTANNTLQRKKVSNKMAANRYRLKKKQECDMLFSERDHYASLNNDLKKKIDNAQSEVSYMKSLLMELLVNKKK